MPLAKGRLEGQQPAPTCHCPPAAACRGGLVGPWTALSPLMALCTDPLEEIRSRALRMLRHLCDK